jgi:methyltransferase (TIGR00027 family)
MTEASKTAVATLVQRALHQTVDTPRAYDDDVAVKLFAGVALVRARERFHESDERSRFLRKHVVERTVFAEERLRRAVAEHGVTQYAILGAGYDTFAYRQPPWARGLRIVEVDQPATQRVKRDALALSGIPEPPNLTFAAADFERQPLRDVLAAAGLGLAAPVFFSWLGVTMYLTRAAVEETLSSIARFPPGSAVAFTFARPERSHAMANAAAAAGEPWLTGFTEPDLATTLSALGFSEIELTAPHAYAAMTPRAGREPSSAAAL